jgi:cell division septation protein DedD
MEHFEEIPKRGIKEKNMYILHLDTPRIIILCSVIIGVIIISFLIGMNLYNNKAGEKQDISAVNKDALYDLSNADNNLDNKAVPPVSEDGIAPVIPDTAKNSIIDDKEKNVGDKKPGNILSDKNTNSHDILTSENIKEIIPPSPQIKKTVLSSEPKPKRKAVGKLIEKSQKHKVVEVASNAKNDTQTDLSNSSKRHFAIQVASFDKKSKAMSEIDNLKKSKYDAYIDKASVKGKNYFRVRIGPIASQNKALEMLNELMETNKYGESYLVKE